MTRPGLLLLLLTLPATAGPELEGLFDPASDRFPLRRYKTIDRLDRLDRLRARGLDPLLYKAPPVVTNQIAQSNSIRSRLWAGFSYAERLEEKQRAFSRLVRRRSLVHVAAWIWQVAETAPAAFARRHRNQAPPPGDLRMRLSQPLQALRHSERQFHEWFLDELAILIRGTPGSEREKALDLLILKGLRDEDPGVRARAARVLGAVPDDRAGHALERVVLTEREPVVLGEAVRSRVRQGGPALASHVRRWIGNDRTAVRYPLVRACRTLPGAWVDTLLAQRWDDAAGRWRDDLETARAARMFREPVRDGPVNFYGIRTHSRRLLFCIDISGSMNYPMDGDGGKREPRIQRTRRELLRTLSDLPERTLFNVVLFTHKPIPWQRRLVRAKESNRESAIAFLVSQKISGGTNIHGIMDYALNSEADTVFLLTDGEPSVGGIVDPALIVEEVAARNRHGGLIVHTVGLSWDQNAELLVNLAHRNGGEYVGVR